MNYKTLFIGAATMISMGVILNQYSYVSVGIGLMWIGFASKP